MATMVGTVLGNWLTTKTGAFGQEGWWLSAAVLIGTAIAGLIASLLIKQLAMANPTGSFLGI